MENSPDRCHRPCCCSRLLICWPLTRPTLKVSVQAHTFCTLAQGKGVYVQVGQRGMPGNVTLQQAAAALATPKPSAQKGPSQRNKQVQDLHSLRMPAFWKAALPAMPLVLSIASHEVSLLCEC